MRAPKDLLQKIADVIRLWKLHAEARDEDSSGIDRSHVVVEMLKESVVEEFAMYGGRPKTEEAWQELERVIKEQAAKEREERAKAPRPSPASRRASGE